ncbi:MAG: glycosyltransferase [Coriobacteriia bacterium]|nr:glycosyltransferase [Coriobacteriia bacterium]
MRAVALIPAHNEADHLVATLAAVTGVVGVIGVIVVDDASHDATEQLALEAGAIVGRLERRQRKSHGKGAALNHAIKILGEQEPFGSLDTLDAVLLLDADLGESAEQAAVLLSALEEKAADMAIACFPPANGNVGLGKVKRLAHSTILELGGFETQAPLSGQRALTTDCLKAVLPFADGFGVEVAMTVRALRANKRLVEVPTTMKHRASDNSLQGYLHRGRQYLDVARTARKLYQSFY